MPRYVYILLLPLGLFLVFVVACSLLSFLGLATVFVGFVLKGLWWLLQEVPSFAQGIFANPWNLVAFPVAVGATILYGYALWADLKEDNVIRGRQMGGRPASKSSRPQPHTRPLARPGSRPGHRPGHK